MSQFPNVSLSAIANFMLGFSAFGSCLAFLFSMGQLVLPNRSARNYFLALMFFCQGVMIGYGVMVISGTVYEFPHFFQVDLPFFYILTPVLYFLFIGVVDENFTFSKKHLLHFAPALLVLIIMLFYYVAPADVKQQRMLEIFRDFKISIPEYLFGLALVITFGYVVAMMRHGIFILQFKTLFTEISSIVLTSVMAFSAIVCGSVLYGVLTQDYFFILLGTFLISVAVCVAYFMGRRYPEFYHDLQASAAKQKYQRSLLTGLDLTALQENLDTLMTREKLYENENISLEDVAKALDLTRHQLSQFLNEQLQKNFSTFINEYRITAAKTMLLADHEASVLTIAYRVGFNSKSAFNRAFLKVCQMSPSKFRTESLAQKI